MLTTKTGLDAYDNVSAEYFVKIAKPKPAARRKRKYKGYLKSEHWATFRLSILSERGGRCEQCQSDKNVQVHHLNYQRKGNEKPSDVRVLCSKCHQLTHGLIRGGPLFVTPPQQLPPPAESAEYTRRAV